MKNALLLILLVGTAFYSAAQSEKAKKAQADRVFEGFSYEEAYLKYNSVNDQTVEITRKKAISAWKLHETETAERLFREVILLEGHTAEDVYNYAAVLRENKKYDASEKWMKKFREMNGEDQRAKLILDNIGGHHRLLKLDYNFVIENLSINSEQQDFSPVFYDDKIVFVSSREGVKPILRRWNRNKLPFLDLYSTEVNGNNEFVNPAPFNKSVNKKFHEGPAAFNARGNLMIFTRNNYKGKSSKGVKRLQLYMMQKNRNSWGSAKPLPFNSDEYSTGHPTISADGKWLYFASNMPGGMGGVDLYKARIYGDGTFGGAINLGEDINTEGDELFPFIHPKNEMLFFASNGRAGLGGLDVYLAQIKRDLSIGKIMNLGAPINGNDDDFGFILSEDQKIGYFSSNRDGGKGSDDIYSFQLKRPFSFGKTIKGIATDERGLYLPGVEVTLFDLLTADEETVTTNSQGEFEFSVAEDKIFNLRGHKTGYFDGSKAVDTHMESKAIVADLMLEKNPGITLFFNVTESGTNQPIDSVKVTVLDNYTQKIERDFTRSNGEYLFPLSDKRLNDEGNYTILLEKDGYLSKDLTYDVIFTAPGVYNMQAALDVSLEKIQIGKDLSKMIKVDPIYFDVNKANIRADAAEELDKIVKVMNENPTMVIELGSHTDSRGNDRQNEALSAKRAKASAAYIAKRISNPERISGKGYGESVPNVVDLSDKGLGDNVELNDAFINSFARTNREQFERLHQMNRRTTFIIIQM